MILGFLGIATFWLCTTSYMVISPYYKENKEEVINTLKKIQVIEKIKTENLLLAHYQSNKEKHENTNLMIEMPYRKEILRKEKLLNPSYFHTYKNLLDSKSNLNVSTIEQLNYLDALFLDMTKDLVCYEEHGNKIIYLTEKDIPYSNREMINNFFISIVIMESEIVDLYFKEQINEFYTYLKQTQN